MADNTSPEFAGSESPLWPGTLGSISFLIGVISGISQQQRKYFLTIKIEKKVKQFIPPLNLHEFYTQTLSFQIENIFIAKFLNF